MGEAGDEEEEDGEEDSLAEKSFDFAEGEDDSADFVIDEKEKEKEEEKGEEVEGGGGEDDDSEVDLFRTVSKKTPITEGVYSFHFISFVLYLLLLLPPPPSLLSLRQSLYR